MLSKSKGVAFGVALTFLAAPALAGGYMVPQQGAKAAGRGNAFVAQADDASAVWYNPAAIAQMDSWSIYLGGSVLQQNTTFTTPAGASTDNIGDNLIPGQFYVTGRVSDAYSIGLGVNTSYALNTQWPMNSPLAPSAILTDWTSRDYHFDWIVKVGKKWGVAFGIDWINLDINDLSSAYDFTQLVAYLYPPPEPLTANRNYILSGDKAGFDFSLHYKGDTGVVFGLTFRGQRIVRMTGKEAWENVSEATFTPGANVINPAGCAFNPQFCPMGAAFTDSTASASMIIPATGQIGFGKQGAGKFDWEVDLLYTHWSAAHALAVEVDSPNGLIQGFSTILTTADLNEYENLKDTYNLYVGTDVNFTDAHAFRFGLSYDMTPMQKDLTRPYNPDADKLGLSLGYGFKGLDGKIRVDVYGQGWVYDDVTPAQFTVGRVVGGTYETTAYAAGASFQYRF